jgi:hypothetical protein
VAVRGKVSSIQILPLFCGQDPWNLLLHGSSRSEMPSQTQTNVNGCSMQAQKSKNSVGERCEIHKSYIDVLLSVYTDRARTWLGLNYRHISAHLFPQ